MKDHPFVSLVPPELVRGAGSVTNVTVSLHGALTLICEASGVPPPSVSWSWENSPIIPGEHTRLLSGEALMSNHCWEVYSGWLATVELRVSLWGN